MRSIGWLDRLESGPGSFDQTEKRPVALQEVAFALAVALVGVSLPASAAAKGVVFEAVLAAFVPQAAFLVACRVAALASTAVTAEAEAACQVGQLAVIVVGLPVVVKVVVSFAVVVEVAGRACDLNLGNIVVALVGLAVARLVGMHRSGGLSCRFDLVAGALFVDWLALVANWAVCHCRQEATAWR